ncbi:MAG TPA: MEDS domain-containing protein [Puia sp.]|nr:MEDS domain-containing protein [Puia sp.]
MAELRKTGIDVLGDIPWGSHFCCFYETKQDLLDMLVPYFKAGLENKEYCLWVTPNPNLISVKEAQAAMVKAVPDFDRYLSGRNIEILNGPDWYLEENVFNLERVTKAWDAKLKLALALGYDGMRVSGDTFWLSDKYRKDFFAYEKQLNDFTTDLPVTLLCTYPLAKSGATEIFDVMQAHQFVISRRQGECQVLETPELILTKAEIKKLNEELEQRVFERTRLLAKANNDLRNEIAERKKAEDELQLAYQRLSYHVENTPLAVIEFNKDLFIKRWSKRAEEIFGWKMSEALGKNVYDPDFQIIYEEDIPAVDTINDQLKKGMVNRNLSLNRNYTKGGNIIYCEWYNSVLRDEHGNVITILSLVDNVTERKKTEKALKQSYEEIRQLTDYLQNIREEERRNIARELHDELGQQLTAIKMDIVWIDKKIPEETIDIKRKLKNIIKLLDGSNQSIRRILSELRPRILDDYGLLEAIEWLSRQFTETAGIPVKFTTTLKDIKVSEKIAICIFRVCQEAFTNITRYSHAKSISNSIGIIEGNITLIIEDDGIGFDVALVQNKKSFGILGMKERVLSLGGKFELVSSHGNGTRITVSLPYSA